MIGFFDETSPQTTSNTQRLWSFTKPVICKNTTKLRANTFGFYALNGNSVIDFKENSKKESICEFFGEIRSKNPGKTIVIILDNFSSHRAKDTTKFTEENGIVLVFLPPYSPDLNPIEFIWKSIKKVISREFIVDLNHMKEIISDKFRKYSSQISFAKGWIEKFIDEEHKLEILGS
ncbi:MAG: hypothetical protein AEth_00545 [Candidatus Argoarchaeum ethanivorans]|uniref:Tc1-like transposase DDE domain-containing protein n=1 Tax=Candidatus Argoarchaeum ethanivorans TaxID=2608793 RepID=A0A8B3S3V1_9EURY|nr:MAG: hypothetical protein AEth_00545 [Candidatus Argoarchaeum ethanivorans]